MSVQCSSQEKMTSILLHEIISYYSLLRGSMQWGDKWMPQCVMNTVIPSRSIKWDTKPSPGRLPAAPIILAAIESKRSGRIWTKSASFSARTNLKKSKVSHPPGTIIDQLTGERAPTWWMDMSSGWSLAFERRDMAYTRLAKYGDECKNRWDEGKESQPVSLTHKRLHEDSLVIRHDSSTVCPLSSTMATCV